MAVGGWACLVFLVTPESLFAKQDYFLDGAIGIIVLNLEAKAATGLARVLFIKRPQIVGNTLRPRLFNFIA
jgi:hypothetical protein